MGVIIAVCHIPSTIEFHTIGFNNSDRVTDRFIIYHFIGIDILVVANFNIIAEIKCAPNEEPQPYLRHDLELSAKPLFIFFENLDIVIEESNRSHPNSRCYRQQNIDVVQAREE